MKCEKHVMNLRMVYRPAICFATRMMFITALGLSLGVPKG